MSFPGSTLDVHGISISARAGAVFEAALIRNMLSDAVVSLLYF